MADLDNLVIKISANATTAFNALDKLATALDAVNTQLDRLDPSRLVDVTKYTSNMSEAMSTAKTSAKDLAASMGSIEKQASNFAKINSKVQGMAQQMRGFNESSANATRALKETGHTASTTGAGGFRELGKKIMGVMTSLGSASGSLKLIGKTIRYYFKGLTAPISLATKAMRSFGRSNNIATRTAKSLVKELTRVTKMLKLMVTRMALRAVIKEVGNGFKSLALHSEEFNNTVSSMMNGAKRLGYSFAAMVSPLINALAPALIYVINLVTKLANALNQVFSALTGARTWNKAKAFTDSWADDIAGANKQAKELKKTVLGFDELNQLQENKDNASGGGGGIADMFDTLPIDDKWKKIADWLKDMWKIGDFYELGKKIGEKLRDMLESIPWEQIRKTSNKLGKSLATLINGFVEVERLGYDIGKTIAQSINTVFEFLNGFVKNLHWDSIGKFIADTFNGFFENIDWDLIKETVITGMAGLAEAIQSFIENFRWDNLSTFISNAINTVAAGISAFVDGIKWEDLGTKIGEQLNKTILKINWHDVGDALGGILEAAIEWAYGLVTTFEPSNAVIAIENFLKAVCEKVDAQKAGETLGLALHKLIEVIQKFWWNKNNRDLIKEEIFGFFRSIFNSMTASDWSFIESTVGALALLSVIKSLIAKNAVTITLTLAVAWAGYKLGGLLGKWFTNDPVYDEYPLPIVIKWTVDNLPTTWTEFVDAIKELLDAWYKICTEAETFVRIIAFIWNPPAWLSANATEKIFNFSGNGNNKNDTSGGALGLSGGTLKQYIQEAEEATTKTKELSSAVGDIKPIYPIFDEASEAAKKAAGNIKGSVDAVSKSNSVIGEGKSHVQNYRTEVEGLTEKQKQLKGIIEPFAKDIDNLKTSTDNVTNSYKNQKTETNNLGQVINNANNYYKNLRTGMESNVSYAPVLTKAQKEIEDSLKNLGTESENFDTTNKTTWEHFTADTANADLGFAGTVNNIEKSMGDCTADLNKQVGEVSKSFTKDKWTFSGVMDGLKKTFSDALDGVKSLWNKFADKMNEGGEIGSERFRIKLPRFAGGGFPEDGFFFANSSEMVGRFSNGKTAVANNSQIVDGIAAGVYNAVSSAMASSNSGNNGGYIANTIVVDGEVIARTVTKAQQRQQMRYSPSMG